MKKITENQYNSLTKKILPSITKNAEPLQDKQVSSHENELQYLKNSLDYHDLKGYTIHQNYSTDRRKKIGEYFLVDDKGTSLTGEWNYEKLNHFILGYGKAFKGNEKLKEELSEWKGYSAYVAEKIYNGDDEILTITQWVDAGHPEAGK